MKRFFVLLTFVGCFLFVFGEKLEIKKMNTPYITIGGKKLQVGDKFDDNAKITWHSEKQAMKVLFKNDLYLISQKEFAKHNITNFLAYKKMTSVRNIPPMTLEDYQDLFEEDFVLLDSLLIKVGWKVNDDSYFIIEFEKEGEKNSLILPYEDGYLVLNRNLFTDSPDEDLEMKLSVKYIEKEYNNTTLITDRMNLYILPLSLDF